MNFLCVRCKKSKPMTMVREGVCVDCLVEMGEKVWKESKSQVRGDGTFWNGWRSCVLMLVGMEEGR